MPEKYQGPLFTLVDTMDWHDVVRQGGFGPRTAPLLVKGAVRAWPAFENWTFEKLAALRKPDGSEVVFRFQNGLVEQGATRPPLDLVAHEFICCRPGLSRAMEHSRRVSGNAEGLRDSQALARLALDLGIRLHWSR